MTIPIRIVACPSMPTDRILLISGEPSLEGKIEMDRRTKAGEAFDIVWAEVMAREKKVAVVKGIGQ